MKYQRFRKLSYLFKRKSSQPIFRLIFAGMLKLWCQILVVVIFKVGLKDIFEILNGSQQSRKPDASKPSVQENNNVFGRHGVKIHQKCFLFNLGSQAVFFWHYIYSFDWKCLKISLILKVSKKSIIMYVDWKTDHGLKMLSFQLRLTSSFFLALYIFFWLEMSENLPNLEGI